MRLYRWPGFDAMTSGFLLLAMVGDGAELKPAMAMATSPIAKSRSGKFLSPMNRM